MSNGITSVSPELREVALAVMLVVKIGSARALISCVISPEGGISARPSAGIATCASSTFLLVGKIRPAAPWNPSIVL